MVTAGAIDSPPPVDVDLQRGDGLQPQELLIVPLHGQLEVLLVWLLLEASSQLEVDKAHLGWQLDIGEGIIPPRQFRVIL